MSVYWTALTICRNDLRTCLLNKNIAKHFGDFKAYFLKKEKKKSVLPNYGNFYVKTISLYLQITRIAGCAAEETESIAPDTVLFFQPKSTDYTYFSYFSMKTCCGYSLEAPLQGASNEYPQHMFSLRNKKNIIWIPPVICSYVNIHPKCSYFL